VLDTIFATVLVGNGASIRVMEKMGMDLRKRWEEDGDVVLKYGIDRDVWLARDLAQ
jgi:RimJ/RimL family protein N-acetyltransferase